MKLISALLLFSTLVTAGQAATQETKATLEDLSGKVLMNKGDGLVSGKAGSSLVDGDRIITLDKSGAKIVFTDGCTVTLEENNIFVINAELGCKALPLASTGAAAPAGGFNAATAALIGAGAVGLGLALGGGGGGGGNGTNDNRPISPQ
jgi:hypothetical protein